MAVSLKKKVLQENIAYYEDKIKGLREVIDAYLKEIEKYQGKIEELKKNAKKD